MSAGEEDHPGQNGRPPVSKPIPHTQVHFRLRQVLENLQDVIVSLLVVLLFILSLQSLWKLALTAVFFEAAATKQALSEIIFVLILAELYRLLIFYLREHRISVALAVEIAIVSTLREIILKGAHELEWPRLLSLSLLLIVLGGLLALERWLGFWRKEASESDAR
jgi:uncharacterized membrane protein (DUF373 family)